MINVDKCVTVHKRNKYADVEIDLWNNPTHALDFTSLGSILCHNSMRTVLTSTKCKNATLIGSPTSVACMFLHNVTIAEAESLAEKLKTILTDIDSVVKPSKC